MLPIHSFLALVLLASPAQRSPARAAADPEDESTLDLVTMPSERSCWERTFGGLPGTEAPVQALATFDDGNGPALYAGGAFATAGGRRASHLARWNGSAWKHVGGGVSGTSEPSVSSLAVF